MTQPKEPPAALRHWTVDQALWWIHEGRELEDPVRGGPHRAPENIERLHDSLKQGRLTATGVISGRCKDILPVEWMSLEISSDYSGSGFVDDMFCDDISCESLVVRSVIVYSRSQITGRSMAAGRLISCAEGNVEGHHAVIDDVLFPADQVRACFPPPARTATERSQAVAVAESELRRIIGASPGLRLLSDSVLAKHVKHRALEAGGQLSDDEYRQTRKAIIREFGAGDWEKAGRQADAKRADVRRILTDLGLAHLAPDGEITAQ